MLLAPPSLSQPVCPYAMFVSVHTPVEWFCTSNLSSPGRSKVKYDGSRWSLSVIPRASQPSAKLRRQPAGQAAPESSTDLYEPSFLRVAAALSAALAAAASSASSMPESTSSEVSP